MEYRTLNMDGGFSMKIMQRCCKAAGNDKNCNQGEYTTKMTLINGNTKLCCNNYIGTDPTCDKGTGKYNVKLVKSRT